MNLNSHLLSVNENEKELAAAIDELTERIYRHAFEVVVEMFEIHYDQDCSNYREMMEAYLHIMFKGSKTEKKTIH